MSGEIYMAAAAALAYEKRLEVTANNLANLQTTGFKRQAVSFRAYVLDEENRPREVLPPYPRVPDASRFWIAWEARVDPAPGALRQTGNPLDLALNGPGFFTVESPAGTRYTRRGNFTLNAEGVLVTQEGWPVQGEGGEIRIEGGRAAGGRAMVSVGRDGTVRVDERDVGRLRVEEIPAEALVRAENGYFAPPPGGGAPLAEFDLAQGFLEMSNVEAVRGMVEMIEILRGYESYQRLMRAVDEINAKSVSELGRSA
ncbi:MAG: flagellar basal-body rod protein FlgF [Desulfobacterales bacterium]